MESNSGTNSKRTNRKHLKRTTASWQTDSSSAGTGAYCLGDEKDFTLTHASLASMFDKARNPLIMGGSFNNTVNTTNINTVNGLSIFVVRLINRFIYSYL
jgi:hypothetical protein